ncbi:MAG: SIS domain-containing protein [Erysipelotrichaceae bacterium]|nr:SIS domain-containing protein [Erysipelotrichaceae bacterium]
MSEITMLDYIRETPEVILNNIDHADAITIQLVDFYIDNGYDGITVIASGSSCNGALCAEELMRKCFSSVRIITPYTFIHHRDELGKTMPLFISQSGCSTNTLEALQRAKKKGFRTAVLVGRDDCDAAKIADRTVNYRCGEEKVGFVTKGVTALASYLMIFSLRIALNTGKMKYQQYLDGLEEMKKAMRLHVEATDKAIEFFNTHQEAITGCNKIWYIGSGPAFGVASEAALKTSETSCIPAIAQETEEFLHGPIYPCDPESLIVFIDNNDHPSSNRVIDSAEAVRTITDRVMLISNDDKSDDEITLKLSDQTDYLYAPLYKLAIIQTISYLRTAATNNFHPHDNLLKFRKENKVATKSRANLYLDLQSKKDKEAK